MHLQVQDLVLIRADGQPLLGPVDLDLHSGERVGLAGRSGAGKTLLARGVLGCLPRGVRRVSGAVRVDGGMMENSFPGVSRLAARRMGWIPQDPRLVLHPLLTIADHLTLLPIAWRKESRESALDRLMPLLERLRLPTSQVFLEKRPDAMSGGQRQRLVLAMALGVDPELLILDEPTTALDTLVQADLIELLDEIRRDRPFGWLWISHDAGVLAAVSDRILTMEAGRLR